VLAIFAARLLNGNRPLIFEDGEQRRDFVSVYDVAQAVCLALESSAARGQVFNIGSGTSLSVKQVAQRLARELGSNTQPELTGRYRMGDIRHCFADITAARSVLGFNPERTLDRGLPELVEWLRHEVATDNVHRAHDELLARGLSV
jgi:dTDP-L-rhamnose 4-epimerase